jgi:hypothetical protein
VPSPSCVHDEAAARLQSPAHCSSTSHQYGLPDGRSPGPFEMKAFFIERTAVSPIRKCLSGASERSHRRSSPTAAFAAGLVALDDLNPAVPGSKVPAGLACPGCCHENAFDCALVFHCTGECASRARTWCLGLSAAPQNPHKSAVPAAFPQETHGRNGIPRHIPARLLNWQCKHQPSLYAGEAGWQQLPGPADLARDGPSVNRQVIGSSPIAGAQVSGP